MVQDLLARGAGAAVAFHRGRRRALVRDGDVARLRVHVARLGVDVFHRAVARCAAVRRQRARVVAAAVTIEPVAGAGGDLIAGTVQDAVGAGFADGAPVAAALGSSTGRPRRGGTGRSARRLKAS